MKLSIAHVKGIKPLSSIGYKRSSGIYFLIKDDDVVYIGQSVNMVARVGQHIADKEFDSVMCIECDQSLLDCAETFFINAINPKLNRRPGYSSTVEVDLSTASRNETKKSHPVKEIAAINNCVQSFPKNGFVRQPEVLAVVGFSAATLWRKVKAQDFPAPVKLSDRITAWRAEDVHQWARRVGS